MRWRLGSPASRRWSKASNDGSLSENIENPAMGTVTEPCRGSAMDSNDSYTVVNSASALRPLRTRGNGLDGSGRGTLMGVEHTQGHARRSDKSERPKSVMFSGSFGPFAGLKHYESQLSEPPVSAVSWPAGNCWAEPRSLRNMRRKLEPTFTDRMRWRRWSTARRSHGHVGVAAWPGVGRGEERANA